MAHARAPNGPTNETMMYQPHSFRFAALVGLAALLVAAPAEAQQIAGDDPASSDLWVEPERAPASEQEQPLTTSSISDLVDQVGPAVVNILVAYESKELDAILGGEKPFPGPDGGVGQGSGFFIHPDGYVLTNFHVVEDSQEIKVRLKDGAEHEARIVGADPKTDIALMKVDANRSFPTLPLGESADVDVGDFVLAIGNPLGLEHTVTSGIVSALGRHNIGVEGDQLYADFIQVDVSINPGNSGGPLVDMSGRVIGINTAIDQKGQGIGFSIPVDMIKNLVPQLKADGHVTRSWLGARVQAVTPTLAESFGLDRSRGALVTEVAADSPAASAGLRGGDVILEFDDKEVRTSNQLPWMVATAGPKRTVDVAIIRDGSEQSVEVELEKHPDQSTPDLQTADASSDDEKDRELRIRVKDLTESLARQLGATSKSGVVVTEVGTDSPAKGAGLRARDVITRVGETSIESKDDFESTIEGLEVGDIVRLKLVRGGQVVYIAFER